MSETEKADLKLLTETDESHLSESLRPITSLRSDKTEDRAIPATLEARIKDAALFNATLHDDSSPFLSELTQVSLLRKVERDLKANTITKRLDTILQIHGGQVSNIPVSSTSEIAREYWNLRNQLRYLLNQPQQED
jgi:hypothetical protein